MFFPCPTSPSRLGKGLGHDGRDTGAWQCRRLCEESASANDEKGDKQRQPKTFFRRLEDENGNKERKEEEDR
jgi:hypothetical protein